jgi:DNA-binding NarL/FixJ family response regulator
MESCRILLADDHPVVLEGLRRILDRPGMEIVGTVRDGNALMEAAGILRPDVIVLDVTMPELNGFEAARQLNQSEFTGKIVFLTMHSEPAYLREAMALGAAGYVLKSAADEELVEAIDTALRGRVYVSAGMADNARAARPGPGRLTARQHEVLGMLARGRSVKEIAVLLHVSSRTVEFHKYGLMRILGVRSSAELGAYAMRHGLIE